MSIRETMNKSPLLTALFALVLIGVAAYLMYPTPEKPRRIPTQAYYTVDDGKTLFADKIGRQGPFDHEGKQAVLAYVYSCDGGDTRFVAYLERYTDEYIQKMASTPATRPSGFGPPPGYGAEEIQARMVKKPGDAEWTMWASEKGQKIANSGACPEGEELIALMPEEEEK